jgi:hypothetical protein
MGSEFKENLDEIIEKVGPEHGESEQEGKWTWMKLLALSTALVAVLTALVSSQASDLSSQAFLQKNNAIYYQDKATDQWAYYQAKGIKANLAQDFYDTTKNIKLQQAAVRYGKEQEEIRKTAEADEHQAEEADKASERALAKNERLSQGELFGQISIALAAMGALLRQKYLWYGSLALGVATLAIFVWGFF